MTSAHDCGMKSTVNVVTARNLLIGAGAYYLSGWVGWPLAAGFGRLTQGITYSGDFNGAVVMPLVMHLPRTLAAAIAGATVVWLAESDRPIAWVIFPTLLYALLGFFGYHWARPPLILDRVAQAVGAMFPAVACLVAAMVASGRRAPVDTSGATPDL